MNNRIATRSQLVGTLAAISDFATVGIRQKSFDWTRFDSVAIQDVMTGIEAMTDDIRVRNLLRDVLRKSNYEALKGLVGQIDPKECTDFYFKTWWQIDVNQMVENRRTEFGVDVEEFAALIGGKPKAVIDYESFHDLIASKALIHAFKETADIPVKHKDEFRRKFKRAYKNYLT